jgi:competence protein ComEC
MPAPVIYIWKKAAFLRLLVPLITGILLQWYLQFNPLFWWLLFSVAAVTFLCFFFITLFQRFRLGAVSGVAVFVLLTSLGALLTYYKDIRNDRQWFGRFYSGKEYIAVQLLENPVEKPNSFKADASVLQLQKNDSLLAVHGNIIIYFKKDSSLKNLHVGSELLFRKHLQPIKNSGNPGAFDYRRYCLFQAITQQVYLKPGEFVIRESGHLRMLARLLNRLREKVLHIVRTHIPGEKEQGLAEALLIGYKNDLDKTLVQSYSNTGVVHVIAISGLHLGLIYWLLVRLLQPLRRTKQTKWLHPVLVITGLWTFSVLAGAQPSILRSAVMFTTIVIGNSLAKKSSIYNSLALSAFLLLCLNPFWLWDVGFQLSYSAVLSIVLFMKPIYNWLYFKNKVFDFFWKLNAVTIAAQILTLPISIFHFHQFPVLFLATNFLAVPLSSVIILGEIFLCCIAFIHPLAMATGQVLSWLIRYMNHYIQHIENLPYSLWDALQLNILQTILMYIFLCGSTYWLMKKHKTGLFTAAAALLLFTTSRSFSKINELQQEKLIIYNVPGHQAMDIVRGNEFCFIGDSSLLENDFARNFHLKPARILYGVHEMPNSHRILKNKKYIQLRQKHILLLDSTIRFRVPEKKLPVELLVLSKNPSIYFPRLTASFTIKQVVIDASVPFQKAAYWKKDCDSLHIPCHNVAENGAFVMSLN